MVPSGREVDRFNRWPDLNVNSWEHVNINHVPRQKDGYVHSSPMSNLLFINSTNEILINSFRTSCGLFVIKYIQLWSGSKLSKRFSQVKISNIIPTCTVNFILGSMFNYFTTHMQKDIEIFRRQLPCDILYSVLNKIKIRDMQLQESEEEIPVSSDSSES